MNCKHRLRIFMSLALTAALLLGGIPNPGIKVPLAGLLEQVYAADLGTAASIVGGLPKNSIDFSVATSDLSCKMESSSKSYVKPGVQLILQAKVKKNTASAYGGGKVSFLLNGQIVDRVPFYFGKSENQQTVKCSYLLPLTKYLSLSESQRVPLQFEVRIEPDALSSDPTPGNNSATLGTEVGGRDEEQSFTQTSDAVLSSIEANSDIADNTAQPGEPLNLKATVNGLGKSKVSFYINNQLVQEKIVNMTKSSRKAVVSFYYFVPWDCEGPLNYQVKLGNGNQLSLSVPVEKFDYQVQASDVEWGGNGHKITPGQNLQIKARVHRNSRITFSSTSDVLRVLFIVNGSAGEPVKITATGSAPFVGDAVYNYKVPDDQQGALDLSVVVDAGGIFKETSEDNNIVQTNPNSLSGSGSTAVNLAVSKTDLNYAPQQVAPGQKVQLSAAIHNTSSKAPAGPVQFTFKINGEAVPYGDKKQFEGSVFKAGQSHVISCMWTVPDTLTEDPTFTLVIDPDHKLSGDNQADNEASLVIPLARTDLNASDLGSPSKDLVSGKPAELVATINNNGPVKVTKVQVVYKINGTEVARKTVDIEANSFTKTTVSITVPNLIDESVPTSLTGQSGYQKKGSALGALEYTVEVDPEQKILETNETNNTAGPAALQAIIPAVVGTIFVRVMNLDGDPLSGADVTVTAGSQQALASTAADGYCTFGGAPFGAYQVDVTRSGFNPGQSYYAFLYSGNKFDYTEIYLDNYASVTGTVTASGGGALADVDVKAEGTTFKTTTNGSGQYTLKLPAGSYKIKYLKKGYNRVMEDVTLTAATSIIRYVSMSAGTEAYMYGYIYGLNGEPLSGMKVEVLDLNGSTVLASATTGSNASYSITIPLSKAEMWVKLKISGNKLSKDDGQYLIRGLEQGRDISFKPEPPAFNGEASSEARIVPWAICASMPETFFNNEYKVDAMYGTFKFTNYVKIENSQVTRVNINTTPEYWLYSNVSGTWSPDELFLVDAIFKCASTIVAITPVNLKFEGKIHSVGKTKVTVKKMVVVSEGQEVAVVYPNVNGSYFWSPDAEVNWDKCRIKYYLKVDPDFDAVNPIAGYNSDGILVEWDPKQNKFTKIGHYIVVGWDDSHAREIYMDE
ncbi:MAG: carboxypeptidase regulatory-like domain-containing protein [Syntrophomonadaceae bacterium]